MDTRGPRNYCITPEIFSVDNNNQQPEDIFQSVIAIRHEQGHSAEVLVFKGISHQRNYENYIKSMYYVTQG